MSTKNYDIQTFFKTYAVLNRQKVAERVGINPNLLRHYITGTKRPSLRRLKQIEEAIHKIAAELASVSIMAP